MAARRRGGAGGGQGRGGRRAADSLVGLLAVGIPSWEEDGDFGRGICRCLFLLERLETKVFNAGGIYIFYVL